MRYPFAPRSNAYLEAGQFWGVPLSDGRFTCGRVLDVPRTPDPYLVVNTRTFLAGLLRWVGEAPQSHDTIAGAPLLAQGFAHILTIRENGRQLLGARPLAFDGIEPQLWLTNLPPHAWVYRGALPVRPAGAGDESLPLMRTWGYKVISTIAEKVFVKGEELPPSDPFRRLQAPLPN